MLAVHALWMDRYGPGASYDAHTDCTDTHNRNKPQAARGIKVGL